MNRRTVLCAAATIGVGSLAGCLGTDSSSEDAPDPIDLSGTKYDYQGGMEIGAHGGPNGQIFYKDEQPESPGGPTSLRNTQTSDSDNGTDNTDSIAWFHTLVFGLFPYHFERRNRDWEAEAIYVTDYSSVEWEIPEDSDRPTMPAPIDAETFADATKLQYVGESDVMGGMGPALHPFSAESEADSFADDYNGTVYEFDHIDRELIGSLQQRGNMEM
jgi:nitrous oxide reductase accessory protein NosL